MKPSRYNVHIPIEHDETIVYNTLSDSRVIVTWELLDAINTCETQKPKNTLIESLLNQLLDLGIIVDDKLDEKKEFEYWINRIKFDNSVLDITLLTTLSCNMQCTYCFEQGVENSGNMSKDTADVLCDWLIERLSETHAPRLFVTFFGGEPLVNESIITYVAEKLYSRTKTIGVSLELALITNGLLLSEQLINKLNEYGLEWIKVTLDGDQETHDQMRPRKGGHGSYQEIINKLLLIKGKVPIIIGSNYDEKIQKRLPYLYRDLKEKGFSSSDISEIAFKPIQGFLGHETNSTHHIDAHTFSMTDLSTFNSLRKEVQDHGYKPFSRIKLGPCEAIRENTYIVDPTGALYKCAAMVGRKDLALGSIFDDFDSVIFSAQNISFMTADPWKNCDDCKFLPICGGGCRTSALSANKAINGVTCEKAYFEKVSTELVKNEIYEMLT